MERKDGVENLGVPLPRPENLQCIRVTSLVSTANPDNRTNYPCFFVAPQCPTGLDWSQQYGGYAALTNIIAYLKATYPDAIDEDRICLTGLSLGAFGTWDIPSTALANTFSCIVPVSGGGSHMDTYPYGLPVWVFHAADDGTVKISQTDSSVTNIRYRGYKAVYTRYASGDHTATTWKAFNYPQVSDLAGTLM